MRGSHIMPGWPLHGQSLSAAHEWTVLLEPVRSSEQGAPPLGTLRARPTPGSLSSAHSGSAPPLVRLRGGRALLKVASFSRMSKQCPLLVSVHDFPWPPEEDPDAPQSQHAAPSPLCTFVGATRNGPTPKVGNPSPPPSNPAGSKSPLVHLWWWCALPHRPQTRARVQPSQTRQAPSGHPALCLKAHPLRLPSRRPREPHPPLLPL